MQYIRIAWLSPGADDPVRIYAELDDQRWEVRKIEVFKDGRFGFADRENASEHTMLSVLPIPLLVDINADHQFVGEAITESEFASAWQLATRIADK